MPLPAEKLIVCPVLIGRERFLAALAPVLDGVTSGTGRVVAISGESGLGKSRLVTETKQRIASIGAEPAVRVLQGHCFEPDASYPYAPFIDLLRTCVAQHDLEEIRACLGPDAPDIAKLLPELTSLIPGLTPSPPADPEQEKRRIFHAVCEFLVRLSARSPLMIVIEDVHWSDDTSLELLARLARRVKTQSMVVFLTFRSDEVQPSLQKVLGGMNREQVLLEWPLERLTPNDVERMIRAIFELAAPVRAEFLDAIVALTEGNPFFIEEVLKAMVAAGDIFYADGGWDRKPAEQLQIPGTIQAAVSARTAQLSRAAARTLVIAAVAGRRFDFDLLQAMTSYDEDQLLEIVKELMSAQLVAEESSDRFVFRHALTQQAIYNGLLGRERRVLHRDIASFLQQRGRAALDSRVAELAHHFFASESWDEAYYYCRLQAEAAQTMNAPSVAVRQFSRAIEAAQHLGVAVPAGIFSARGQAFEATGRFESALADYDRALRLATGAADRAAECQSLMNLGLLWAGRDYERAGEFLQRANDLAAKLGDPVLHARTLNRLGNWLVNTGDTAEGVLLHEQALAAFRAAGDEIGESETLDLVGMAYGLNGDPRAGVLALDEAISLLLPRGPSFLLCSSLTTRATWSCQSQCEVAYSANRDCDQSTQYAVEAIALAQQLDSPAALSYAEWVAAGVHESCGRFSMAERHAAEGLRLAVEIDHEQWMTGARFILGHIALSMLSVDRAIEHLTEGVRLARAVGSAWWLGDTATTLSLAYMHKQDLAAAESLLASTWPESHEPRGHGERRVLWAWGRLALARGEPERAIAIADRVIASAGRSAGDPQPIPEQLRLKGEAHLALKKPDVAATLLIEARDAALERGAPPTVWPIRASLARAYQSLRRTEDAERECTAAREEIAALAASIDDPTDRERFERAALDSLPRTRPPSENRIAKQAFGGLTAREREVAALVARGKSNRDIAEELVLGERTIETHVGNILSKLSFSSRAQIAAWAVESGLTTAS